jgi:uncharacterized membrane protein YidH (DUF202 family)
MEMEIIRTLHIIFAGMWLINFLSDSVLKRYILKNKNKSGEKKLIHLYLTFTNLFGMVGAIGILITGIALVSIYNPFYSYFQMNANHWLTAKQVLMVVLLVILGVFLIPTAKKVRSSIGNDMETQKELSETGYENLNKLFKLNMVINIIVLINFLFAITHRLFGQ